MEACEGISTAAILKARILEFVLFGYIYFQRCMYLGVNHTIVVA